MKKKLIFPMILLALLAFFPAQGQAAAGNWSSVKLITKGVKAITGFVQTVIRFTDTFGSYDISFQLKFNTSLFSPYYNRLAIKFGNSSNATYDKMLEMWTSKDNGTNYIKGLEFAYKTDSTKALIVFHTGPFITAAHPTLAPYINSKFRLEYDGTATPRWMKYNADHGGTAINYALKTCAYLERGSGYYDIYITSHLDQDFNASGTNDAYTFGARILTANTTHYYTLAKQGISDIKASGSTYDFLAYGAANPLNCAKFDKSVAGGFVSDGYTDGTDANYPLPADIAETKLPDVNDVETANYTFATPNVF